MNEAVTTKAALIAMRKTSVRTKVRSGDMKTLFYPPLKGEGARTSHPFHRHRHLRAVLDGLVDHAIALGELEQEIELVLRCRGFDLEAQPDLGKSHRRFLVDTERAAEIE